MNWRQALAGCTSVISIRRHATLRPCAVASLIGVVMIARPAFIFGRASQEMSLADGTGHIVEEAGMIPKATPAQRLAAVGYVHTSQFQ